MGLARFAVAVALLLPLSGCHSAYIDAAIHNATEKPVSLLELDYPSASFGTQTLEPNATFHYRFKLLGSGDLKLIYTDADREEHTVTGPRLNEGDEGFLSVEIQPGGVNWTPRLRVGR